MMCDTFGEEREEKKREEKKDIESENN